jgi:hypothetical protein
MAAFVLFASFGHWPYWYYQLLRWVTSLVAAYTAYTSYNDKKMLWAGVFGLVAIVFNPIAPFFLERNVWQIWDMLAGIVFVAYPFVTMFGPKRRIQKDGKLILGYRIDDLISAEHKKQRDAVLARDGSADKWDEENMGALTLTAGLRKGTSES